MGSGAGNYSQGREIFPKQKIHHLGGFLPVLFKKGLVLLVKISYNICNHSTEKGIPPRWDSIDKKGRCAMKLLEERIRQDGVVVDDEVLKVDRFLNHQMDVSLFVEMGKEWARLFGVDNVTKILTIEASGIGIACVAAEQFGCPVIFAKKSKTKNINGEVYSTQVKSFTHGNISTVIVSKQFLKPGDRVLLIDDFLANGAALEGLIDLVEQSGATLVGAGIAVEKAFQPGGDRIRARGVRVESLARVKSMNNGSIEFC
jgi:xanthine phosphoribosyltransferase